MRDKDVHCDFVGQLESVAEALDFDEHVRADGRNFRGRTGHDAGRLKLLQQLRLELNGLPEATDYARDGGVLLGDSVHEIDDTVHEGGGGGIPSSSSPGIGLP